MKIATWNVNSVKVRLPHLLAFLEDAQPDVLCLQETKCLADDFPRLEIAALGYQVETLGQRAYNGVALVSREPARDPHLRPPRQRRRAGALYRGILWRVRRQRGPGRLDLSAQRQPGRPRRIRR